MLLARLDEHGKAAWPLGLAVFAFLVGSGRRRARREKAFRSPGRWSNLRGKAEGMASWSSAADSRSNGDAVVNMCRTVELGRLGVQEQEFRTFLNRLCLASSNEEFDKLVAGQRHAVAMRHSFSQPCS